MSTNPAAISASAFGCAAFPIPTIFDPNEELKTMQDSTQFETLAIQAVAYLLTDDDTRQGFLNATGLEEEAIRAGLENQGFLAGVLGYLLSREDLLLDFCEQNEIPPELPARAQQTLAGVVG
jgi:hypothetical protein